MQLDNKALGRRIRYFRKRRGLSQAGLAELVDCGNTYISYIETAKKGVGLEMLVSIANALHVSADELLIDSLDTVLKVSSFQFSELLTDCSDYEIRVLLDVLYSKNKRDGTQAFVRIKRRIRPKRHIRRNGDIELMTVIPIKQQSDAVFIEKLPGCLFL